MKDAVRPRNEDPTQRSLDRQHWHEDDEKDKKHHRRFLLHLVFDVLIVAGTFFATKHFLTKEFETKEAKLQHRITLLENHVKNLEK